jgi:hypothetical protein
VRPLGHATDGEAPSMSNPKRIQSMEFRSPPTSDGTGTIATVAAYREISRPRRSTCRHRMLACAMNIIVDAATNGDGMTRVRSVCRLRGRRWRKSLGSDAADTGRNGSAR